MNGEAGGGFVHLPERYDSRQPRDIQLEVNQLVDHQVVAALQGRVHTGAVNLEIPDAGLDDQEHEQGQNDGFYQLS